MIPVLLKRSEGQFHDCWMVSRVRGWINCVSHRLVLLFLPHLFHTFRDNSWLCFPALFRIWQPNLGVATVIPAANISYHVCFVDITWLQLSLLPICTCEVLNFSFLILTDSETKNMHTLPYLDCNSKSLSSIINTNGDCSKGSILGSFCIIRSWKTTVALLSPYSVLPCFSNRNCRWTCYLLKDFISVCYSCELVDFMTKSNVPMWLSSWQRHLWNWWVPILPSRIQTWEAWKKAAKQWESKQS